MNRLLQPYPRRTVRIDVALLRRNATAISERARFDKVVILRCGKPKWVIVDWQYFEMLECRARQTGCSSPPPRREGRRSRTIAGMKSEQYTYRHLSQKRKNRSGRG